MKPAQSEAGESSSERVASGNGHGPLEILEIINGLEKGGIPSCVVGISALMYFRSKADQTCKPHYALFRDCHIPLNPRPVIPGLGYLCSDRAVRRCRISAEKRSLLASLRRNTASPNPTVGAVRHLSALQVHRLR
jgi:hypothetical protein